MGVSTDYIVKAIKTGNLKAERIRPGRGRCRIHEDDFVAWLKELRRSRLLMRTGTLS